MKKKKVGIVGATGMVGQRLLTLLYDHPELEVAVLAASARSAGLSYEHAVEGRWKMEDAIPEPFRTLTVYDATDVATVAKQCELVFCAVDMPKAQIQALEEAYACAERPVISNNSANRQVPDVPTLIPEVNHAHLAVLPFQKQRLGTRRGFIVTKPNCSVQSYVPPLTPLLPFGIEQIAVTTYQAVSGAGKTLSDWQEMTDNVIPFIAGEEEKSEQEPLKLWGRVCNGRIVSAAKPQISAQCIRVPVSNGHTAAVFVKFRQKPSQQEILDAWSTYSALPQALRLPHAPHQLITYFPEADRPQVRLDRGTEDGMGICVGRLREDPIFDYKFVGLSHNTLRGAAGGALLTAELLNRLGYLEP